MNKKHFTLIEHHSLYINKDTKASLELNGHIGLPKKTFREIHSFVMQNSGEGTQFLKPSYMKQFGETLKAQQYVGVIESKDGTIIEILPKIEKAKTETNLKKEDNQDTRLIFLKMLKTLRKSPFKQFNLASLKNQKMHLLEVFITMFCDELTTLIQKGIKSDYIATQENSKFLKGRLLLSKHIRQNLVHKERFFVEFDEYTSNRIENRLIRTTLEFLLKKAQSTQNKKRLREFLFTFDEISPVSDTDSAFKQVKLDRQMQDYEKVLRWAKLFLKGESFSSFKGNNVAFALLFDMNRVFEDYVAHCLRKSDDYSQVETQVSGEHLLISPNSEFRLKPDLRITLKNDGSRIIGDTKWKVLNASKSHHGISQGDIYQMYAYGKKYEGTKEIWLIYPAVGDVKGFGSLPYKFEDDLALKVLFFDCESGKFTLKSEALASLDIKATL